MTQNTRFQFVARRSSPITKIVATLAILLSMAALIALHWTRTDIEKQTQAMRSEAAALEAENADLTDRINALGSVGSVKQIAEEELDLVDPDTVVINTD